MVYALAFVDRALVAVAGGPIKAELNLTDTQFGLLGGTAFALLFCLGAVPLGWLADRTDRRRLIAAGILGWSVMTALCGLAPNFQTFILARIGVGLGEACLVPAGISLIRSGVAPERRGRAVAMFLIGATSGTALALLGGGWLLGKVESWRTLFLGAAVLGLPVAVPVLMMREPAREPWPGLTAARRHILRNRAAYGWLTGATACSIILAQAQAMWVPQLFQRSFGLAPGQAAILTGLLYAVSAPIGQWIGGSVIDRLRRRGFATPSHLVLAVCCALCLFPAILFCTADSLAVAAPAYWLFNLIVFASTPAGMSGWQRLTPSGLQGSVIALLTAAANLAAIGLGPPAIGALADRWSLAPALLVVVVAAAGMGLALALRGRSSFAEAIERLVDGAD